MHFLRSFWEKEGVKQRRIVKVIDKLLWSWISRRSRDEKCFEFIQNTKRVFKYLSIKIQRSNAAYRCNHRARFLASASTKHCQMLRCQQRILTIPTAFFQTCTICYEKILKDEVLTSSQASQQPGHKWKNEPSDLKLWTLLPKASDQLSHVLRLRYWKNCLWKLTPLWTRTYFALEHPSDWRTSRSTLVSYQPINLSSFSPTLESQKSPKRTSFSSSPWKPHPHSVFNSVLSLVQSSQRLKETELTLPAFEESWSLRNPWQPTLKKKLSIFRLDGQSKKGC